MKDEEAVHHYKTSHYAGLNSAQLRDLCYEKFRSQMHFVRVTLRIVVPCSSEQVSFPH